LRLYRPSSAVGKYYSILFSLPHWEILAITLVSLSIIALVMLGTHAIPLLLNSAILIVVLEVYRLTYPDTVFHRFKRVVGLSLAVLIYEVVYFLLLRDWVLVVVASSTMVIAVLQGLDGTRWWRYVVSVTPPVVSIALYSWISTGRVDAGVLGKALILALTLVLLDYIIYLAMGRHRVDGYRAPDLGTLFLRNWLDKKRDIEDVFDKLSTHESVHPRILFMDNLLVVYTDLHYGPFSNTGSSELPGRLGDFMGRLGYSVITLHGFGSHDRNLASSRYLRDYLNKMLSLVMDAERRGLKYHGAFRLRGSDNWEVLGVVFDKLTIMFVSRPGKGIDDIPYSIFYRYNMLARRAGLGDLILVDSHNWEKQEEFDLDALSALLEEAVREATKVRDRPPVDPLVRYECFKTSAPGLINGDACLVEVAGEGRERVVLLYLRGNNMKPGSRSTLLEAVAEKSGAGYVEVFTNDEHSETGIRASLVYIPVHDSPSLPRDVESATLRLVGKAYKRGVEYAETRFDTKTMGYTAVVLEKLLRESYVEAAVLLLSYAFLLPLALRVILH